MLHSVLSKFTDSTDMDNKLNTIVDAIKKDNKKVTFFLGAGISTSCGIPDFRSPKTGLYANLKRLNLPYPEAVFDIDYFKDSPHAFYTLAHELYPGNFLPSKFHYLIKLFQDKEQLKRVYTQNIDTLERLAGVKDEFIVEAHGSFAKNHCIDCNEEMSALEFKKHIFNEDVDERVSRCNKCKGLVKPDIVFFGEALPTRFFEKWELDADEVELAVVAGSSLTVFPFASLPSEVNKKAIRLLVNKEIVGDFKSGKRKNDIIALDSCDDVAEKLADLLGWKLDLDTLIEQGKAEFELNIAGIKNQEPKKAVDAQTEAEELAEKIKKVELEESAHATNSKADAELAESKKDPSQNNQTITSSKEPENTSKDDSNDVDKLDLEIGKLKI